MFLCIVNACLWARFQWVPDSEKSSFSSKYRLIIAWVFFLLIFKEISISKSPLMRIYFFFSICSFPLSAMLLSCSLFYIIFLNFHFTLPCLAPTTFISKSIIPLKNYLRLPYGKQVYYWTEPLLRYNSLRFQKSFMNSENIWAMPLYHS